MLWQAGLVSAVGHALVLGLGMLYFAIFFFAIFLGHALVLGLGML